MEQARAAAGDKDVGVATPGTVRQCLDAGVLDELNINLIPVVFGTGRPFFDGIEREVDLVGPEVIEGRGVTHLRYAIGDKAAPSAAEQRPPARSPSPAAPERQRANSGRRAQVPWPACR